MKKIFRKIKKLRDKKIKLDNLINHKNTLKYIGKGGKENPIEGSPVGEFLNKNYKKEIPYITSYYPELDKEKLIKKIEEDEKNINNAESDYMTSKENFNKKYEEKKEEKKYNQSNDTKKNIAANKIQDRVYERIFKFLTGISSFFATFFAKFGSKAFFETIKTIRERLPDFFKAIHETINSKIIIEHVIPILIIIITIIFILYIFGFKVNTGNIGNIENKGNMKNVSNISNTDVAINKPIYNNSENIYDKIMNIILSIPGLKSIFANYKGLSNILSKTIGGVDTLDEYSINRDTINNGRNDNIYNIKLGKYFGKNDNDIYSIIIPTDLEINYEDVKELLTDFNKLPKNIQTNILNNKEVIKLNWDLENNKFIMKCNNTKDKLGNKIDLYGDCSKKIKYPNKTYDIPRERLIYNTLNSLVPLNI